MKDMIKDTLILFVITLIAGTLLGFVNELTKEPIAAYEAEKKASACSEVFYEENEVGELVPVTELVFEPLSDAQIAELNAAVLARDYEGIVIDEVYGAYVSEEDSFYGYVIGITTKEGYNGAISFYVGVTKESILKGVSILAIGETPGLGMNAENVLLPQFRNVNATNFTVVKTGAQISGEVDAITGATITSDAITGGVNAACECFAILQEGGNE